MRMARIAVSLRGVPSRFVPLYPYEVIDVKPAGNDVGGKDEVARPHFRLAERYENEPFVVRVGRLLVLAGPAGKTFVVAVLT